MSTTFTPYTYLIGWSKLNKWYYGARWSAKCNPSDLWNPYKTSSNVVKQFILENGQPDVIEVRKTFSNENDVRSWEEKVLIKLHNKTPFNHKESKWLNVNPTASPPCSKGRVPWNKDKKIGPFSNDHKNKISSSLKGRSPTEETRKIWSEQRKGKVGRKWSEVSKAKLSETKKGKPAGTPSIETRKLWSEQRSGSGNPNFGKHASDETKRKIGEKSKGTSWYNDGIKNHKIKPEVAFTLGYIKGRIKKDQTR
jgi:hypothetical protein